MSKYWTFLISITLVISYEGFAQSSSEVETHHFPEAGKCQLCHLNRNDKAPYRLLTGDKTNSIPELCGQCHGIVKRDWDRGSHGKQIGGWKTPQEAALCTKCHEPHHPKFRLMKALKSPRRPRFGIIKESHHEQ